MKKIILLLILFNLNLCAQDTVKKIFFKTLIFPAWGHRSISSKMRSNIYLMNELVLWTGYFGSKRFGDWKKDEYITFASQHAGIIHVENKDDTFFKDLKFYESIYEHNILAGSEVYLDMEEYFWEWDSESNQKEYEKIRTSSKKHYRNATFFIGGIILHHLVSAIDAVRIYNQNHESSNYSYLSSHTDLVQKELGIQFNYCF